MKVVDCRITQNLMKIGDKLFYIQTIQCLKIKFTHKILLDFISSISDSGTYTNFN